MRAARTFLIAIAFVTTASADTISFGGLTHGDVYVSESPNLYFVHFPETGEVKTVLKRKVRDADVHIDTDKTVRQERYAAWGLRHALNAAEAPSGRSKSVASALPTLSSRSVPVPARSERFTPEIIGSESGRVSVQYAAPPKPRPEGTVTDGMVKRLKLDNVPLRDALDAILKPLNLNYAVHGDMIWISTGERIRTEAWSTLTTRIYEVKNQYGTLPKIVLHNPGTGAQAIFQGGGASQVIGPAGSIRARGR